MIVMTEMMVLIDMTAMMMLMTTMMRVLKILDNASALFHYSSNSAVAAKSSDSGRSHLAARGSDLATDRSIVFFLCKTPRLELPCHAH